jgi:hypothetical protein
MKDGRHAPADSPRRYRRSVYGPDVYRCCLFRGNARRCKCAKRLPNGRGAWIWVRKPDGKHDGRRFGIDGQGRRTWIRFRKLSRPASLARGNGPTLQNMRVLLREKVDLAGSELSRGLLQAAVDSAAVPENSAKQCGKSPFCGTTTVGTLGAYYMLLETQCRSH